VNRAASRLARSPFSTGSPQDELSFSDAPVSLLESKTSSTRIWTAIKREVADGLGFRVGRAG